MKVKGFFDKITKVVSICLMLTPLGCSSIFGGSTTSTTTTTAAGTAPEVIIQKQVQVIKAPGVVEYVWEEPMVDVVNVPPGLDPEGIYYRPSHQEIVEIRQGRWKYYREKKK